MSLRIALISDIHSNLEALTAVLEDIENRGIKRIFCLGDVIGYGPNPNECLDIIMDRCELVVKGNHDNAIFEDPDHFNFFAQRAIYWTRESLYESQDSQEKINQRLSYLENLPYMHREEGFLFVHGSPRDPINDYVDESDIHFMEFMKFKEIFSQVETAMFDGHTHVPCVITEDLTYLRPFQIDNEYELGKDKVIINVGSVGQPRDGNTKSSYVEVDGNKIKFHRVRYDFIKTMNKIKTTDHLHDTLGIRLLSGT